MPDIRFTLFDSDNFYQHGLRLLLQDYLHALNECHRLYPQLAPIELQRLDQIEVIFRTPEDRWGCACCYQSPLQTPRHRQVTLLVLDDNAPAPLRTSPALLSIHRRDGAYTIRNTLQATLERFCQQAWLAQHTGGLWKCQKCRIAALSSCEKKVLGLMSIGMSACTIAGLLHRSQKTISAHKRSAMRKLDLRKNTELNKMLLKQMGLNQSPRHFSNS